MTTQYLVLSFFFRTQVALNIEFFEKVAGSFSSFLTNFPANPLFYGRQSPLWSTIFSTPTMISVCVFRRFTHQRSQPSVLRLFRSLSFCLQLFPLFLKLGGGSGPECGPGLLHLGQCGLHSLLRPGQSVLCVLICHLAELAGAILRVAPGFSL